LGRFARRTASNFAARGGESMRGKYGSTNRERRSNRNDF